MKEVRIKRSPMFYVGDKYRLINEIKQYFPTNINTFIEPFVGGGTVFLNVKAKKYILNDIDMHVYQLHEFLKAKAIKSNFLDEILEYIKKYNLSRSFVEDVVSTELKRKYKKTYYAVYNKKGYNKLKADFNSDSSKDPMLLYILIIYGFNRMLRFNSKGEFNVPVGNVDFNRNVEKAILDYFDFVVGKEIKLENLDFMLFFKKNRVTRNDFVYFDPPYLITFSEYNKIWNKDKEVELLGLLDELNEKNIRFAISNIINYKGRKNSIFETWMCKYKSVEISSNYISYHDNSNKKIEEVLVYNF